MTVLRLDGSGQTRGASPVSSLLNGIVLPPYSLATVAALKDYARPAAGIGQPKTPRDAATREGRQRMKLDNKVAIITGAATGIGQAIAITMAREGASVVVDYVGKPGTADDTVNQIQSAGGKVLAVEADVSQPDQVANLIGSAVSTFGKLDIFVNKRRHRVQAPHHRVPFGPVEPNHRRQPHRAVPVHTGRRKADADAGRGGAHHQHLQRPPGPADADETPRTARPRAACGC